MLDLDHQSSSFASEVTSSLHYLVGRRSAAI